MCKQRQSQNRTVRRLYANSCDLKKLIVQPCHRRKETGQRKERKVSKEEECGIEKGIEMQETKVFASCHTENGQAGRFNNILQNVHLRAERRRTFLGCQSRT